MSGTNSNGYAESKRLLLGIGDLYISDVFVGNLKGKVELKWIRKYAYQRAGNNMADQKGEVTDEELTLTGEVCDIKLSQLRRAFGINQAVDTTTQKAMLRRDILKLSGTISAVTTKTPLNSTAKLYSLDRKTTYVSGTDYKFSGSGFERISGAAIPTGSYVIVEYEWTTASGNSLQFGGESKPVNTFQVDYVHVDSAGKSWQIRLFKAMTNTSLAIAFNEAQKGTYTTHNIEFKALVDTTKPEGANMGEIIEESPLT
jgi:hypothetical protein